MSIIQPSTKIVTPDMVKLGFEEINPSDSSAPRLTCCTEAPEKRGKSHWAFTAPGPVVGILSTDMGTREILRKFLPPATKKRFIYNSIARAKDLLDDRADKNTIDRAWGSARDCMAALVDNKQVRTIVLDTATELWELIRLARFGKLAQVLPHQYVTVNNEFSRTIMKLPAERDGLNCVFVHKVKREYKEGKDGKANWTGRSERAGFGDAAYIADVVLRHYRTDLDPDEHDGRRCRFGVKILDSRYEPNNLIGLELEGEDNNFGMLAMLAFPDTDPGYWE